MKEKRVVVANRSSPVVVHEIERKSHLDQFLTEDHLLEGVGVPVNL
jgi:hypothetical protein